MTMISPSRQTAQRSSRQHSQALVVILCLSGCSLQDFDRLTSGTGGKSAGGNSGRSGGSSGNSPTPGGVGNNVGSGGVTSNGGVDASAGVAAQPEAGGPSAGGASSTIETGVGGATGQAGAASTLSCDVGLTACPGANACVNLATGLASGNTLSYCGTCDTTCSMTNASAVACTTGQCQPTCLNGFSNCNDAAANDGCETNLNAPANCGQCGRACSPFGVATAACTSGVCTPTCSARYADCNHDTGTGTDDGCEAFLDDLAACGTGCTGRVPCAPDQVCNSGVCGAAQGLTKLTVPFTASGQTHRYGDKLAIQPSLLNATLTFRAYAPGATAGLMTVYLIDQDYSPSTFSNFALASMSTGWTDLKVPVGGVLGSYDPSAIYQVTIEVLSSSQATWTAPCVIYLDSIRSSNGTWNEPFDADSSHFVNSTQTSVDGADFTWVNALPPP